MESPAGTAAVWLETAWRIGLPFSDRASWRQPRERPLCSTTKAGLGSRAVGEEGFRGAPPCHCGAQDADYLQIKPPLLKGAPDGV